MLFMKSLRSKDRRFGQRCFQCTMTAACLFLLNPSSHAWTDQQRSLGAEFRSTFSDAYTVTVWSGIQARVYTFDPREFLSTARLGSPRFEVPSKWGQSMPFELFLQATATHEPVDIKSNKLPKLEARGVKLAPLVIHLPGSFSNLADAQAIRAKHALIRRGYHVLQLPNPLSVEFLESQFRATPGDLRQESEIFLRAIQSVLSALPLERISELIVMGESYGATLAPMIANQLDRNGFVVAEVHAWAPVWDALWAQRELDRQINRFMPRQELLLENRLDIAWDYYWVQNQSDLPQEGLSSPGYAPGVFSIIGFQSWLKESGTVFAKREGLARPPNDLTFAKFELLYAPKPRPEPVSFLNAVAPLNKNTKLYVLSCQDEILNRASETRNVSLELRSQLLLLEKCGHQGFTGFPWFESFQDEIFGPRIKTIPYFTQSWILENPPRAQRIDFGR